ncbi:MerR family transcriptional regulator [Mesonia maritima]|uniref:DNA-binding transcriptional MerR regulator n=1 Tax=Mesonia maritima TaxID=1793873 RepID=A0ABU1K4D0_9FLAO|nr:MerR family transcriptional regulator [Mesonia maritima]MDR6300451.1 DNA-binding transcriptional MerR regulator [Mesonia maritima]
MTYIKQRFTIKDLEILSGIKAHTIRIWEKRYDVLSPDRTDTNIRMYDVSALQRILNIAFLNENGYKISRISKLNEKEVNQLVNSISTLNSNESRAIKALKVAMFNFDQSLFIKTYDSLFETKNFREIFQKVLMPLLNEIGTLWQTNTINPAHEHFISNLIRQKLYVNIERLQTQNPSKTDKIFVLFLPEDEIHDLGLLYVTYEILSHGYKTIYLGHSLPMLDLRYLTENYENIHFVSYFTVKPDDILGYINEFKNEICSKVSCNYWILGRKTENLDTSTFPESIKTFKNIDQLILNL